MRVPEGHGILAGGEASAASETTGMIFNAKCALEGRWNQQDVVSAAPSGAEILYWSDPVVPASLHHRLISKTPPASRVHDTS